MSQFQPFTGGSTDSAPIKVQEESVSESVGEGVSMDEIIFSKDFDTPITLFDLELYAYVDTQNTDSSYQHSRVTVTLSMTNGEEIEITTEARDHRNYDDSSTSTREFLNFEPNKEGHGIEHMDVLWETSGEDSQKSAEASMHFYGIY